MALPDVGANKASKMYVCKRPRLRPIYDSVVARGHRLEEPVGAPPSGATADAGLHPRLVRLRENAQLAVEVSRFDVLAWMEGTYGRKCPWPKSS
jgi:hypothetical protein